MLAFPDKEALLGEVAHVLEPGGRFAFTVEEGRPLTQQERAPMPGADTVWLIELAELTGVLREAGLDRDLAAGVQLLPSRDSDRDASLLPGRLTPDRRPDRDAGHR